MKDDIQGHLTFVCKCSSLRCVSIIRRIRFRSMANPSISVGLKILTINFWACPYMWADFFYGTYISHVLNSSIGNNFSQLLIRVKLVFFKNNDTCINLNDQIKRLS